MKGELRIELKEHEVWGFIEWMKRSIKKKNIVLRFKIHDMTAYIDHKGGHDGSQNNG